MIETAIPQSASPETFLHRFYGRVHPRYQVSVDEYVRFREQGFLVVRGLVSADEVERLKAHTERLMDGSEVIPGVPPPPADATPTERAQHFLRIHMLHRVSEIHERYMLHPRILDVLEALIGPDVLALQTMLFIKGPGKPGQGYHQDSYYIPTRPDTLCGAWLAIDRADEENGCLWMTPGSQHEPIYPPPSDEGHTPQRRPGEPGLKDLFGVRNVSHTDEHENGLTAVAQKYAGREVKAEVDPGDVVFFGGHVLHRSHANHSADRFRRAFVGHYCNARSFLRWNHGLEGGNEVHILARGDTHLPYAQPKFGSACAALLPKGEREQIAPADMSMMGGPDGKMKPKLHPAKSDGY
ncbi:MAG TPA: phytanoyl-CoA dioxygenase family protein [Limnochordia bacterium]|nr:phytanoyl-CoA dioxygenase family protein [Limnochordia bacterium]